MNFARLFTTFFLISMSYIGSPILGEEYDDEMLYNDDYSYENSDASPYMNPSNEEMFDNEDCVAEADTSENSCRSCLNKSNECCEVWGYPFRLYIDHVEGRWLDNSEGYTSFGSFLALQELDVKCYDVFPFLDVREHVFNNGRTAANLGGGFRFIDRKNYKVFGINAFYDYREKHHKRYSQLGIGLEMLSYCWDLRLNGYFPMGKWGHSKSVSKTFEGGFFAECREHQSGMWGGDVEVGRWLKRRGACDYFDLYGAIGAYYYSARKHHQHNIIGGEARLAANLGRYFSVEVRGGYDQVYHASAQARVTLTIPFDIKWNSCCKETCLDNCCLKELAYQPVRRQEIIALDRKDCCFEWNWDDSGCNCSASSSSSN